MTPDSPSTIAAEDVRYLIDPIYRVRGWMKFLAVLGFIGGAFYVLTIIGIVVAWIPILLGAFLWQAASAVEHAWEHGSGAMARQSLDKLRVVFLTYGVLAAIGVALMLVALVLGFGAVVFDAADPRR